MIDSNKGDITFGPLEMRQFELLNKNNPFKTRLEAEDFVAETEPDGVFQITESDGKFYIWYRP